MARIGILDMQGGVVEHLDHLRRLGIDGVRVKSATDFGELSGLIIPGGESTCLSRLLRIFGLDRVVLDAFDRGLKLWGTCAGAILLANRVEGEEPHLGVIDIQVSRNAFGSQLDSFTCVSKVPRVCSQPIPLTFIRAPKITAVGEGVDVLLRMDDYVAAARDENVLVTVFHPELTPSLAFHRYFVRMCGINTTQTEDELVLDGSWNMTSWTRHMRIAPEAHTAVTGV